MAADPKRLGKIVAEIESLLREAGAPGNEHERIREVLNTWAISQGFTEDGDTTLDGKRPDVHRRNGNFLFVGDAKDSQNETVDNEDTLSRFFAWMRSFCERISSGEIPGGYFAIATNDEQEADRWRLLIKVVARALKVRRSDGTNAVVIALEDDVWIAYW